MTPPTEYVMPVGRAAELLGISPSHLHNLDADLKPARDRFQRRWYRPADVERVATQRAAAKGAGAAR